MPRRQTPGWRIATVLPHAVVVGWMVFLAVTLWQHAAVSVQPPWGDGLSYLWKAASFWNAVDQGRPFNPLNLFPSVRPPGTILMSYPFGITDDFRGYHFRSVFVPLLCVVCAIYIAAGAVQVKQNAWIVAGFAILMSSLPMFFWLDWNDEYWTNNGWGMVDNFQAGVAALAGGAMVRSVEARSQRWLLVGAGLACLTFLIKQSGLMLMGTLGLVWLVVLAFEWRIHGTGSRALGSYMAGGLVRFAVIYCTVFGLSILSAYFSQANFRYAMKALGFYRDVAPDISLGLFHHASGEWAAIWLVILSILFFGHLRALRREVPRDAALATGFAVGAVISWLLGLWYWIFIQAGGNQIRYFYPFMLLGGAFAVPAVVCTLARAVSWMRGLLLVACVAPAVNMALLLTAGDSPSLAWQKATGVSVSVGHHQEEVANAKALLARIRATRSTDARVYFTPSTSPPQTFVFVGAHEKAVHPGLPTFEPVSPMDWTRGFVVRTSELIDSDYVVTRKFENRSAESRFSSRGFATFDEESNAFDGWLSTLDARSGVELESDGKRLRVLRIVDRELLANAVHDFVSRHDWRPEFVAANVPAAAAWSDASVTRQRPGSPTVGPVSFENIYVIHAIRAFEADNGVRVEFWWEELTHEVQNARRFLFVHLLDADGGILQSQQIPLFPYVPPSPEKRWRYGRVEFHDVLPNAAIRALGFGIYEPQRKDGGLLAGSGDVRTDWGGKRSLMAITQAKSDGKAP